MATTSDLPIGTIIASVLSPKSLPPDWLLCDGSQIPAKYQQLKTILGAETTPNLIGRTLIGIGDFEKALATQTDKRNPNFSALSSAGRLYIGDTGGEAEHQLTVDELPAHSHLINNGNFGYHNRSFKGSDDNDCPFETQPAKALKGTDKAGGDKYHFNSQPYYAVSYIIYAGQV